MLSQLPGMLQAIRREHRWVLHYCERNEVDGIISDNRYGFYHPQLPSVILTHQLAIQTGRGNFWNRIVQQMNYKRLKHFDEVWVVDEKEIGLAGKLSHPKRLPAHSRYIGLLSQFENHAASCEGESLLILLSGPEPQRNYFSDLLWKQVSHLNMPVVFVEGKAGANREANGNLRHYDLISGTVLQEEIKKAKLVICRAGYSTLMDLVAMNKRAIIIPTPGQTEQEYLADYLSDQKIFFKARQENFSLPDALKEAAEFPFQKHSFSEQSFRRFKPVLNKWLF